MSYKFNTLSYIIFVFMLVFSSTVISSEKLATQTLIKNVNIFDRKNKKLAMGQDVLIEANLIKKSVKV